ncbi:hypothetical protein A9W95_03255 [Mycobacterium sp. 1423905.2]|nr:hypothetical protein A9W95_03255 [Mycobacterium sp. 1423905.2]
MQYLRVALVTAAMPVVATVCYHAAAARGPETNQTTSESSGFGLSLLAVIVVVGAALARYVRLPGAGLLVPMAITIALELSGLAHGLAVPMVLVQIGIVLIVLQTVLAFDRESLRAVRRILPGAFGLIMVINVAAAGMGVLLAKVAGLSMLDGYLATSPGGIYAVLGTAAGSGSNVTFVMAAQVIRVVVMLFAAPFVARLFTRFTPRIAMPRRPVRGGLVAVPA